MRRYARIDASLCSYLVLCDRCSWRGGPVATAAAAEAMRGRHELAEHPDVLYQRRRRERAACSA